MSLAKQPLLTLRRISFWSSFEIDFWLLFDIVLKILLKALMASGSGLGAPWRWLFRDRGRQNQDFCFFVLRWIIAILLGPPMQNGHFYFCTPDVVGIRFLKSCDFARGILTTFQNTLRYLLFYEKCVFFSFDHPSHVKLQLFF